MYATSRMILTLKKMKYEGRYLSLLFYDLSCYEKEQSEGLQPCGAG